MSVGGIRSAGANIGECGWDTAGSVVCAAFCGITAWIRGRNLRYRSTVGETPGVPGARGEGGALGVRLNQAGFGRVGLSRGCTDSDVGEARARGVGRLVPGGERRQAEVAQNAMESSP